MPKIEAVPVKVKREVYNEVKKYSMQTGVPAAKVIAEALVDWLNTVGLARLDSISAVELKVVPKGNVIEFPKPQNDVN